MNRCYPSGKKYRFSGYSLVEVVIALTILTFVGLGITQNLLYTRKVAESNIRESTATAIVSGYLEQIKSMEYERIMQSLETPSLALPTRISHGELDPLYLDEWNKKEVVIDMDQNNQTKLTMLLLVRPQITDISSASNGMGISILIYYEWEEAVTDKPIRRALRTQRSYVPTF